MRPPYERFKAWSLCHELAVSVYRVTREFPKHELYGLTSQARRAAFSAAANIAEGSAKRGKGEFQRYLNISIGSLSELAYTLRLARDLEILSPERWQHLDAIRNHAGAVTWKLYEAVANRRRQS